MGQITTTTTTTKMFQLATFLCFYQRFITLFLQNAFTKANFNLFLNIYFNYDLSVTWFYSYHMKSAAYLTSCQHTHYSQLDFKQ